METRFERRQLPPLSETSQPPEQSSTANAPEEQDDWKKWTEKLMDRGFVAAAASIGLVYATIIGLVYWLWGKEAAGVAGLGLNGLAAVLLRKFERLRFKRLPEHQTTTVVIPAFDPWYFMLLSMGFLGIDLMAGLVVGGLMVLLSVNLQLATAPWTFLTVIIIAKCVGFCLGGYLCGRTIAGLRYSYAALGVLSASFIGMFLPILQAIQAGTLSLSDTTNFQLYIGMSIGAVFWILYIGCAMLGVRLSGEGKQVAVRSRGHEIPPMHFAASATRSATSPRNGSLITPTRRR